MDASVAPSYFSRMARRITLSCLQYFSGLGIGDSFVYLESYECVTVSVRKNPIN